MYSMHLYRSIKYTTLLIIMITIWVELAGQNCSYRNIYENISIQLQEKIELDEKNLICYKNNYILNYYNDSLIFVGSTSDYEIKHHLYHKGHLDFTKEFINSSNWNTIDEHYRHLIKLIGSSLDAGNGFRGNLYTYSNLNSAFLIYNDQIGSNELITTSSSKILCNSKVYKINVGEYLSLDSLTSADYISNICNCIKKISNISSYEIDLVSFGSYGLIIKDIDSYKIIGLNKKIQELNTYEEYIKSKSNIELLKRMLFVDDFDKEMYNNILALSVMDKKYWNQLIRIRPSILLKKY